MTGRRMIHSSICTAPHLNICTRDAELLFILLLSHTDDLGSYEGDPRIIKAACFPIRDEVTVEMVEGWLNELAEPKPPCPTGSIVKYKVNNKEYLYLPNFYNFQTLRTGDVGPKVIYPLAPKRKYPKGIVGWLWERKKIKVKADNNRRIRPVYGAYHKPKPKPKPKPKDKYKPQPKGVEGDDISRNKRGEEVLNILDTLGIRADLTAFADTDIIDVYEVLQRKTGAGKWINDKAAWLVTELRRRGIHNFTEEEIQAEIKKCQKSEACHRGYWPPKGMTRREAAIESLRKGEQGEKRHGKEATLS